MWLALSGEPLFDAEGMFHGFRGIGRNITPQKRGEQLLRLEHAVARALAQANGVSEGLQSGLRAICDIEGWDYGRCFRVDPASGDMTLEEAGSRASRPPTSSSPARATPGRKASRCSPSRRASRAARSPPSPSRPWRRAAPSACSRSPATGRASPTSACWRRRRRIGSLFGQFLQRKQAEEMLRESEERFRRPDPSLVGLLLGDRRRSTASPSIVHGPNGSAQIGRGIIGKHPWSVASVEPGPGRLGGAHGDAQQPPAVPRLRVLAGHARRRHALLRGERRAALQRRRRVRRLPRHRPRRHRDRAGARAHCLARLQRRAHRARQPHQPRARRSSRRSSAPGATAPSSPACSSTSTASSR